MRWAWREAAFEHIEKVGIAKLGIIQETKTEAFFPEIMIADLKGDLVSIPDKSSFMLVNIWSAMCKDCIENLDILKRLPIVLSGSVNKDWRVIGVSVDKPEDIEPLAQVIRKYRFEEVGGYYDARGELRQALTLKAIPATLIVDDHGRILYVVYGIAPWLDPDVITFLHALQHVRFQKSF